MDQENNHLLGWIGVVHVLETVEIGAVPFMSVCFGSQSRF